MEKKPLPTWVLVWIAVLLLGLVVLFANRDFYDSIGRSTGLFKPLQDTASPQIVRNMDRPLPQVNLPAGPAAAPVQNLPVDPALAPLLPLPEEVLTQDTAAAAETADPPPPEPAPGPAKKFAFYWVNIGSEGRVELLNVSHEVPASTTPLTAVINRLLDGPSDEEAAKGALSLIPAGTRLLSARIQGETAYLSFSEEFQFNSLGMEGFVAQLRQIIFTATQFPKIKTVQFLIKGQFRDSLGDEGISIAKPLDRGSFN